MFQWRMHLPGLMWQLCLLWVYVCHAPLTDAPHNQLDLVLLKSGYM
uniref:Uncharacterized protein n=1 Tax=Setaria viridis TaxID=4556 RepID=A0A4U6T7V3_SETVI|nr:hypothetical protein SEVIR_9G484466v2 [Setaria viridis]